MLCNIFFKVLHLVFLSNYRSGYGLFSSEKLSELTHVDPKNRMTEIAKMWKSMSSQEKDKYAKRVQI